MRNLRKALLLIIAPLTSLIHLSYSTPQLERFAINFVRVQQSHSNIGKEEELYQAFKKQEIIKPETFGAKGDGVTDDTDAIQRFLSTPNSKYVFSQGAKYLVNKPLIVKYDKSEIFGNGSVIKLREGFKGTGILIESKNKVWIHGMNVDCGNSRFASGVFVNNSKDCKLSENTFSQFGDSGIKISNSGSCSISSNYFLSSSNNDFFGFSTASDVNLQGNNSQCKIIKNICKSGGGYAIQVRTNTSGEHSDDHFISGNIIDGYNSYGIMLYRNTQILADVSQQSIEQCRIVSNQISNISGIRPSNPSEKENLIFGAGIYLQGAEKSYVSDNWIKNTCINTTSELLAPGGIGVANVGKCQIINNNIQDSQKYGIHINDSNGFGAVPGEIEIQNNNITESKKSGIKINERGNISIIGNFIKYSQFGVNISASSYKLNFLIKTNVISATSMSGIIVSFAKGVIIDSNTVAKNVLHSISLANSANITLSHNDVSEFKVRGIELESSCSGSNSVVGNLARNGGIGLLINVPAKMSGNKFEHNRKDISRNYSN